MTAQEKRAKYLAETSTADRCKDAMEKLGYVSAGWWLSCAENTVRELADEGITATIERNAEGQYCVVVPTIKKYKSMMTALNPNHVFSGVSKEKIADDMTEDFRELAECQWHRDPADKRCRMDAIPARIEILRAEFLAGLKVV